MQRTNPMICWSVHCKLSHCIFSSARGKSAASPGPTKQLRSETTAALQRGPSPQLLQCRPAQQTSWAAKLKTDHFLNQNAYGVGYFLSELHNHVQNLWNLYPLHMLRQCKC